MFSLCFYFTLPGSCGFLMQMGVMSPTKLRMKLLGSHGGGKKQDEGSGKSPSRLNNVVDDDDHPKNSLLPQELDEGALL
jgi:hypothetical protein